MGCRIARLERNVGGGPLLADDAELGHVLGTRREKRLLDGEWVGHLTGRVQDEVVLPTHVDQPLGRRHAIYQGAAEDVAGVEPLLG